MKTLAAICALALLTGCTDAQLANWRQNMQNTADAEQAAQASRPQVVYVQEQPAIPPAYVVPNVLVPMQRTVNTNCNTVGYYTSCQSY